MNRAAVIRLAVPMMAASLAVAATHLVVVAMLGHLGDEALYVRAAYTPLVFVFLALGEALSATTQVAVALNEGRGDRRAGVRAAIRLLLVGLLAGVVVVGGCWLLAPEVARFVGAPPDVSPTLTTFMRWMPAASVLVFVPLACAATLRGLGRARSAAAVTLTYLAIDIATVALAAFGLGAGVRSLVWAAVLGAVVAGALGVGLVLRSRPRRDATRPATGQSPTPLRLLRSVGLPILGSYVALCASGLIVIRILSRFGPEIVSGFSVGYSVQTLAIVPAIALGSACAIHVNHLRGAGRGREAAEALHATVGLALRGYVAIALAITASALVLPKLITSNAGAAAAARDYLLVIGPALAALGVVLVVLTLLEQAGAGAVALASNVAYVVLFTTIGAALTAHHDSPLALYLTMALVSVIGAPGIVALGRRRIARLATADVRPAVLRHGRITPEQRDGVRELFDASDFLFKTYLPSLTSEAEIERLLTAGTRVITLDDRVLGLAELEVGSVQAGHYRLHYRLSSDVPNSQWVSALQTLLAAERDEREILRLTYLVHDFDVRGRDIAEQLGFVHEGVLPAMVEQHGRRHGTHYYAYVSEPAAAMA